MPVASKDSILVKIKKGLEYAQEWARAGQARGYKVAEIHDSNTDRDYVLFIGTCRRRRGVGVYPCVAISERGPGYERVITQPLRNVYAVLLVLATSVPVDQLLKTLLEYMPKGGSISDVIDSIEEE